MNEDVPLNASTDVSPAEQQETEVTEVAASSSAGALLTAHREARGWTIEQVANQLNLAARQIDALEHDNYAVLPGMVIVRGFIRAYAKLLQVDAAPILALVKGDSGPANVLPPARSAMSASFSETQLLSENGRRGFPVKTIAAVVILLLAAALIAFEGQRMGWIHGASAESAKTREDLTQATQEPAPLEQNAAAGDTDMPPSTQETSAPLTAQSASIAEPTSAVVVASAATPAEVKNSVAAPNSKNVLAIQAHQDSWVEVRRADNSVLASNLLKAGAAESFDLTGPVSMVIGNAAGVSVSLRGAQIDVTGNASNVARLNLK